MLECCFSLNCIRHHVIGFVPNEKFNIVLLGEGGTGDETVWVNRKRRVYHNIKGHAGKLVLFLCAQQSAKNRGAFRLPARLSQSHAEGTLSSVPDLRLRHLLRRHLHPGSRRLHHRLRREDALRAGGPR